MDYRTRPLYTARRHLHSLLLVVITCLCYDKYSDAFPAGAGSCFGGSRAAAGVHASRNTTVLTSLSDININVNVGSYFYQPGSRIPMLPGIEYSITVSAVAPAVFRGILIRMQALEGQSMAYTLVSGMNTKLTDQCRLPETIGISHFERSLKTTASGRFMTNTPGQVQMDISVVVGNEPTLSLYGHGSFTLDVTPVYGIVLAPSTFAPAVTPTFSPAPVVAPPPTSQLTTVVAPPAPVASPLGNDDPSPHNTNNRKNFFQQSNF